MDLSFHSWKPGQLLTPAHFEWQERALLAHMAARLSIFGAPAYGFSRLEIDAKALLEGIVAVRSFQWLRRDGVLVCTSGNAHLPEPLEVSSRGTAKVRMWVARADDLSASEGSQIVRSTYRLTLGEGDAEVHGAEESCRLVDVRRAANGRALVLGDYVPPLLRVGTSPFLRDDLSALWETLGEYDERLQSSSHRASSVRERASDIQRRLSSGRRLLALLEETGLAPTSRVDEPVGIHPHALFRELRDYACELAAVPGTSIDPSMLVYDHANLGDSFRRVFACIQGGAPEELPEPAGLEFERDGRLFVLKHLSTEVLTSPHVVLSISGAIDATGLKLASPTRLPRVHASLLPGVRIEEQPVPHAPVGGVETRYFRVDCTGEEWGHVVRERALAFHRLPGAGLTATLLWRGRRGTA